MRSTNLLAVFLLLQAGFSPPAASAEAMPELIAAFRDICVKTAPSFAGAEEAAKAHGIDEITGSGSELRLGFNKDKSIGIQLKKDECVVTSPTQGKRNLTKKVVAEISDYLKVPVSKQLPAMITIEKQQFVVLRDSTDGEAFVLFKKK